MASYLHSIKRRMSAGITDDDETSELDAIRSQLQQSNRMVEIPPWMNGAGKQIWSNSRVRLAKMVLTNRFETTMGLVIAVNFFMIIFETDKDGTCYPEYYEKFQDCPTAASKVVWLWGVNLVFLILYTLEAMLRIYVFRLLYFRDKWNYLDLFIVLSGWLQEIMGSQMNLAMLRVFRLARLFRAFKVFSKVRELYLLINGFASSCKAIFFGMIMLLVMLLLFSILMVELVHPVNSQVVYPTCASCSDAFNSVAWSTLTLFREIIAGGSWIISYDVIQKAPHVGIILVFVVAVVSLGTMNLILSVIVERAAEAREKDVTDRIQQKDEEANEMKLRLLRICSTMDTDSSYTLTFEELREAYQKIPDFRNILKLMHIAERDLNMIFSLMDSDDSGSIDYKEFCEELYLLSLTDQRWAVADTKNKIDALKKGLNVKLEHMLSHFNTRSQCQEKQLLLIELMLKKLMPAADLMEQPATPPSVGLAEEVSAKLDMALLQFSAKIEFQEQQLNSIESKVSKLAEAVSTESIVDEHPIVVKANDVQCQDDVTHALYQQYDVEALIAQLQHLHSVQLRVATEVQQQAAALQRQADYLAQFSESVYAEKGSQQTSKQKEKILSPGSQMDQFEILVVHGVCLGHLLAALENKANQLGFSVDKTGELIALLGKSSKVSGLSPITFDLGNLSRISRM